VRVFDFSDVSPADADASTGALRAGHPYIVMEYAKRGSLDQLDEILTWRDLLGITRSLLTALGHAHARGVLHRDIKPANILLGSDSDLRPSIKLTDFGLARALSPVGGPGTGMRIVGTPEYMAPEQIEGLWREQGPCTDLYAIGCVAYELASGRPPFSTGSNRAIAAGHLSSPIPPLSALSPVPDGFTPWLERMLAKEGHARFQCAADAAHALDLLADAEGLARAAQRAGQRAASPTWTFLDLPPPTSKRSSRTAGVAMHPEDAPPIPEDWRELERWPEGAPLLSSGLSLFGLRTQRIVGRESERDILWQRLQEVSTAGRAGAVLLRGPAGYGKHRLAQWLMETAHEAGAATILEATHTEIPGPAHGLPRMVATRLQTVGLSGPEVIGRTEAILRKQGVEDPYEWEHLGRMLLSTSGAVTSRMQVPVGSTSERLALVARIIERETVHRPVIVHIASAQWGLEAISLVRRMLQARGERLPLLFVISCDTEALDQRPVERRCLETLCALPDLQTIEVGPLPDEELRALIRDLLRVEPGLARSVQERSGGSPLFAVQVVQDWVRRGVLVAGEQGYRLPSGESRALPDSIHEVWQGRMEQALQTMHSDSLRALSIAAALGMEVDEEDWAGACAVLKADRPPRLIGRMVREGLATVQGAGWAFAHGMLRESIERAAGADWARINRGCANMLAGRASAPGLQERIGRHLVAAGEADASLEPLLEGAREKIRLSDYHSAGDLLDIRERMLERLALPAADERWGRGWLAQCLVHENRRELSHAKALASRCVESARRHGWSSLIAIAFRWRGILAFHSGDLSEADAMFARAEGLVGDDGTQRGHILRHWAKTMGRMGDTTGAAAHLEAALDLFNIAGFELESAHCIYDMAALRQSVPDTLGAAEDLLNAALDIYQEQDYMAGVGDCWNGLAEVHRKRGNLAAAEEAYETAQKHLSRVGAMRAVVPLINQGLIRLERGASELARPIFEQSLATLDGSGREVLEAYCHLGLLSCSADLREWHQFDHHLSQATKTLAQAGIADRDLAWPAERGGDRAVAEGERGRAVQAWQLALAQWDRLGSTQEADRLRSRLGADKG
jgi:tetratricopeptide (TPR) repeat protein